MRKYLDISVLLGRTLSRIDTGSDNDDISEVRFYVAGAPDESRFVMYHEQDCCESVWLAERDGEWEMLVGAPITLAEERSYDGIPLPYCDDSYTWTYYVIGTPKGTVHLRWFGTSNGYYSESVSVRFTGASLDDLPPPIDITAPWPGQEEGTDMEVKLVRDGTAYVSEEVFDGMFDTVMTHVGDELTAATLLREMGVYPLENMVIVPGTRPVDQAASVLLRDMRRARGYVPSAFRLAVGRIKTEFDPALAYDKLDLLVGQVEALTRPII